MRGELSPPIPTPSSPIKCRKVLPNAALSAFVENFVGRKSDGRNGPLGMDIPTQRKRPAARLTLSLPFDRSRKQVASLELFSRLLRYHCSFQLSSALTREPS